MERITDRPAGKAISAYVILKGSKRVATVHVLYGSGGGVQVDVLQCREAAERSEAAARKAGEKVPDPRSRYLEPFDVQQAKAGGYGYDKFTAALSGMWVDGHKLTDHCGERLKLPRGKKLFPRDFKAPKGYQLSNFTTIQESTGRRVDPWAPETQEGPAVQGYTDCYRKLGLTYLEAIGYTVLKAI